MKSDKSLIEIMKKLGAKHKGQCPHCGKLYEFDELDRMFNPGWYCEGCPPKKHVDEYGEIISQPYIHVSDLVDVELWDLPEELLR